MKQIYSTPKSSVAKTQLRATLLAGSDDRPTIPVDNGKGAEGFDTRNRQLLID
ncbi:MAG: hypothetical protein J5663_03280 [Bacteroidaceae bacterium]|nr:hypothetical protein [Bacteroidaceae bacterium]